MSEENRWTRAASHDIDEENPLIVEYETGEKTRFVLNTEALIINEKPRKIGVSFDEDIDLKFPDLRCRNYRNLEWCDTSVDTSATPSTDIEFRVRERSESSKIRIESSLRENQKSRSLEKNIEEVQAFAARKFNIEAPIILQTGGNAPRHASHMKGLLGTSCILFNHPAFLKSTAEKLQIIHNIKQALSDEARQKTEEIRAYAEFVHEAAENTVYPDLYICKNVKEKPITDKMRCKSEFKSFIKKEEPTSNKKVVAKYSAESDSTDIEMDNAMGQLEGNSVSKTYSDAVDLLQNHLSLLGKKRSVKANIIS